MSVRPSSAGAARAASVSKRKRSSRRVAQRPGSVRTSSNERGGRRPDVVGELARAEGRLALVGEPARAARPGRTPEMPGRGSRGHVTAAARGWAGPRIGSRPGSRVPHRGGGHGRLDRQPRSRGAPAARRATAGPRSSSRAGHRRRPPAGWTSSSSSSPSGRDERERPAVPEPDQRPGHLGRSRPRGPWRAAAQDRRWPTGRPDDPRPSPGTTRARAGRRAPGARARAAGGCGSRRPSSRRSGRVSVALPSPAARPRAVRPASGRATRRAARRRGARRASSSGAVSPRSGRPASGRRSAPCRGPRPCA